jgi:hypothetical protein
MAAIGGRVPSAMRCVVRVKERKASSQGGRATIVRVKFARWRATRRVAAHAPAVASLQHILHALAAPQ